MHTAMIRRIGVDAAGTLMVTGSDDKTARLWALPEGGRGGRSCCAPCACPSARAMTARSMPWRCRRTANGSRRAAGMRTEARRLIAVYIFEAATGRLVTRLGRLGNVILHLAFSPDGGRLAATLGGGEGMRLWETAGWRLLAEDKDYGGKDSYGAAFDGANRLFTVAYDGQIRRYGADGRLEAKAPTQGGKEPFSVAVHPRRQARHRLQRHDGGRGLRRAHTETALRRRYERHQRRQSQQRRLVRRWRAALCGRSATRSTASNPVVIWQDEGRGKRRSAAVAKHHHAASALRRRHRGGRAGSRLRPDRGGWRKSASGRRASSPTCATSCATPSRCPPMASACASVWAMAAKRPSCSIWPPSA